MKRKLICLLTLFIAIFSMVACSSSANNFDRYHGYQHRILRAEGYDSVLLYETYNVNNFESTDSYFTSNSGKTVIMKIKTSSKSVYLNRGEPEMSYAVDKLTSPYITLTRATVTELFCVSDKLEYDISVGDKIWIANEYIVDDLHKMIYLPETPLFRDHTYESLILPNAEYLLFATPEYVYGENKYKGHLIFESNPQVTVPLNFSSWIEYWELLTANGFPPHTEYYRMWNSAIEKYIK